MMCLHNFSFLLQPFPDALDEVGEAGRNPLVEILARNAHRLPDWLGLIVTSRPENAVKTQLQGLHPLVLDTSTEANRADFREYERRTPAICFPAEFGMN